MTSRGIALALAVLLSALLTGCVETEEVPEPGDEPTAAAESSDFEELSGAKIPDSAESVEVFSVGDIDPFPTYVATFILPSEEDAKAFCASGDIGNYFVVADGELSEEEHERHFIGETELVDPWTCSSAKQGERVDRSVVFSFPEGERVSVWAITEEYGR
ncbi:hypothetical protein GCM10007147_42910 [Nocardiopsis kunsanensis]|uniref:Lipoprotein n=1 Tax=Nocardiopsis kunsanensis TaxID=141693 RepID=A0A918XKI0_9ACTN|nr:hypothetical protein [Nocardiopsis kunsanensis]GHD36011.1 hypothetical protein GCM10007147_42910 [Nocardiopsis kunsanensis]